MGTSQNKFPGFDHLYWLVDSGADRAFFADIQIPYPLGLTLLRSENVLDDDTSVCWAAGSATPGDVIWSSVTFPMFFSDRVVRALEAEGITGWRAKPIAIRGKLREFIGGFNCMSISGRCGPIDYSAGNNIEKRFPNGVFPVRMGLFFDPSSWDGSDFFMPAGQDGHMMVTERVEQLFSKARFRDVSFIRLDRVENIELLNSNDPLLQ